MLQNVPQAMIVFHAIWLAGGVVVPVNPMNKARELGHQLSDSGSRVVVCLESLYEVVDSVRRLDLGSSTSSSPRSSRRSYAAAGRRVPTDRVPRCSWCSRIWSGAALRSSSSQPIRNLAIRPCSTYTSGTTGSSKGAVNTHHNLAHNAEMVARWYALGSSDITVGMSPMFHITGIVLGNCSWRHPLTVERRCCCSIASTQARCFAWLRNGAGRGASGR